MSVISYKCPNCDGELIFDPNTQKYKCEYCFSLFSQEELDAMGQDASAGEQTEETQPGRQDEAEDVDARGETEGTGVIYTCPSCGAEIVTEETTAATFCYYCHNPVVLGGRLSGELLPDQIIPFSFDRKAATEKFLEYVGKKKFIPRAFFNKRQIDCLSGVYFPYWVYEASIKGRMRAEATKLRVWRAGDIEYTETRFFELEREGGIVLKNMTENALKKANHVLAEGVLPYRMEEAKPFQFGYLSGFLAEKRDMERAEFEQRMQKEAKEYAGKMLRETVQGYQTVTGEQNNFELEKEKYSYTLLPVWTLTYRGRNGKLYYYSMNGQTGEVCGELPIEYKRVAAAAFLTAAFVLLLVMLGGFFLW